MKQAMVELVGVSPYSQSKAYDKISVPANDGEPPDAYEVRTWRNRMHVDGDGVVFVPPMAFANCIKEAARRLSIKIPGKRNATYTKSFDAGVMVTDPLVLGVKRDAVPYDRLFVPSDGIPGSGKRVYKNFPRIDEWSGKVMFYIFDDQIQEGVFRQAIGHAGLLVGLGRFRPEKRGYYGRFSVKSVQWTENVMQEAA